jgi:hypothetical protein
MTNEEALQLIRALLQAPNEEKLMQIISQNLPRFDGTFFAVLNRSVEQLRQEGKEPIAQALERLGDTILRMRTLI